MAAVDDVDKLIEQWQLAGYEFVKGNPEPVQRLYSHRDDVSLNNPFGPPVRGWEQVAAATQRGASQYREGERISWGLEVMPEGRELPRRRWRRNSQNSSSRHSGE